MAIFLVRTMKRVMFQEAGHGYGKGGGGEGLGCEGAFSEFQEAGHGYGKGGGSSGTPPQAGR